MGRRVSEWEATAQRQADAAKAKAAAKASVEVRVQIQEEIEATKKQRKQVMRKQEYGRQLDRQREDIHLAEVTERLADIEKKKLAPPKLRRAVPDADPDRPVRILPMRPMREEPLP